MIVFTDHESGRSLAIPEGTKYDFVSDQGDFRRIQALTPGGLKLTLNVRESFTVILPSRDPTQRAIDRIIDEVNAMSEEELREAVRRLRVSRLAEVL